MQNCLMFSAKEPENGKQHGLSTGVRLLGPSDQNLDKNLDFPEVFASEQVKALCVPGAAFLRLIEQ